MIKYSWTLYLALFLLISCQPKQKATPNKRPNIIILLADDMGYGDLSSYGHPTIQTPNIDQLANQGIRFTSYVTAPWCVPSRAQLLTGLYPPRVHLNGGTGAGGKGGLRDSLLTLAEGLKKAGYATGMAGKWHLGYYKEKYLPPNQGFDTWLGLPYSNDYKKPWVQTDVPLVMYRGTEVIEYPVNQRTLTTRYTKEAVKFINEHAEDDQPFFFYLAYNMPHLPIHTTEEFRGQSEAGFYGDVIETIDWSVGQVLQTLKKQGLAQNTIVFFTSDNGPWNNLPDRMLQGGNKPWHTGSPGLLRGSKATTYEGGTRVPAIIRWPGHIEPGQDLDLLISSLDIYRSMLEVGGADLPDYSLDGFNMLPFLTGQVDESPRNAYAYFLHGKLEAMRVGPWKLRLASGRPQLFNLQSDPGERWNRAEEHPEIVNRIRQKMQQLAQKVHVSVAGPKNSKE